MKKLDTTMYFITDSTGFTEEELALIDRASQKIPVFRSANMSLGVNLVCQLVDSRVGLTNDDCDMVEFLNQTDIPYIIVATKTDKLNKTEREKAVNSLVTNPVIRPGTKIILFSSETKEGKGDIWDAILSYCD